MYRTTSARPQRMRVAKGTEAGLDRTRMAKRGCMWGRTCVNHIAPFGDGDVGLSLPLGSLPRAEAEAQPPTKGDAHAAGDRCASCQGAGRCKMNCLFLMGQNTICMGEGGPPVGRNLTIRVFRAMQSQLAEMKRLGLDWNPATTKRQQLKAAQGNTCGHIGQHKSSM